MDPNPDNASQRTRSGAGFEQPSCLRLWNCAFHRWLTLLVFFGVGLVLASGQSAPTARQLKTAFLTSFPRYIEWPASAFAASNSPIVFGVLGDSQLEGELQKLITGKSVNGRPLFLKHLADDDDPAPCHVLFIGAAHQHRAREILAKLQGASVLTVGESDDFLDSGGVINLSQRDRRIRLEMNLAAARLSHLTVSAGLLNVAEIVKGKED